jgi:hypothetical protein
MLQMECIFAKFGTHITRQDLIEALSNGTLEMLGGHFEFASAWAKEETKHPDDVKLVFADRLGSLDPNTVRMALEEIAEFLEVSDPGPAAAQLTMATFSKPQDGMLALLSDTPAYCQSQMATPGGHLVEVYDTRLQGFEDLLMQLGQAARVAWTRSLTPWTQDGDIRLAKVGQMAIRGVASLPSIRSLQPKRGIEAHNAGMCRPCVFAMRGACERPLGFCQYCHEEGHSKPKRLSKKVRDRRKVNRPRTLSPSGLSE